MSLLCGAVTLLCGAVSSVSVPAGLADLAVTQLTSLWIWQRVVRTLKNLCLSRGAGTCNVRSSVSCSLPTLTSVSWSAQTKNPMLEV